MAAIATRASRAMDRHANLPGGRYDHLFFSSAALLMLVTVFVGFARSYYLAGIFRAPLPSPIIHVHGAVFSLWILLLVTQTSLVAAGRVEYHRRLGLAAFALAGLMVVLGVMAGTVTLRSDRLPLSKQLLGFYVVPLSDMLMFGTLVYFGFRARRNAAEHKRLMYMATTALLSAPLARWPLAFIQRRSFRASLLSEVFLVALVIYDVWSTRRVHRATKWAGAFLVFVQFARPLVGRTEAWQSFAGWVRSVGH
jgi:FtsH-binding integral membrane protein